MRHHTSIHHIFSYVKEHSRDAQIKKKKNQKPELLELNLVRSTNFYFVCFSDQKPETAEILGFRICV